jgi:hypothetical protein
MVRQAHPEAQARSEKHYGAVSNLGHRHTRSAVFNPEISVQVGPSTVAGVNALDLGTSLIDLPINPPDVRRWGPS